MPFNFTGNPENQVERQSFEYGHTKKNRRKRTAILYENGTRETGVRCTCVKMKQWNKLVGNNRKKIKGKTEG